MLNPDGQESWLDATVLIVLGLLATAVRLAQDPPRTILRTLWLLVAGLGLASGGWVLAKSAGLDGWAAMACAWVAGALGADALLPVFRRWLENRLGLPPGPPSPPRGS